MAFACKDCTRRKVGCHSTCPDYFAEKVKREAAKKRVDREKVLTDIDYDFIHHRQKTHSNR